MDNVREVLHCADDVVVCGDVGVLGQEIGVGNAHGACVEEVAVL